MQKLLLLLPLLAITFLGYIGGAIVARFDLPPYGYLEELFAAVEVSLQPGDVVTAPWTVGAKPLESGDLQDAPVRDREIGLGRYQPDLSFAGLTLYTPMLAGSAVRLIDMQGAPVHEWRLATDAQPINGSQVLPDGALLALVGQSLVKLDRDAELLWSYGKTLRHDLDVATDGRIAVLGQRVIEDEWPGYEYIETPFLDDQIVVLAADGRELNVISLLEAVQNSAWESLLMYADPEQPEGDLLQASSVRWLDAGQAAAIPGAMAGDLLLSLRQIDTLVVLDPEARRIKWAWRSGKWRLQHDVDVLPNGNLLVFDNRGDDRNGGKSRVVEANPRTEALVWEYPGVTGELLFSSFNGAQQRLPNGNTLITETNNGRILEVTEDGQVAWEYRIPEREKNAAGEILAPVASARRFVPAELPFVGQPEEAE